MAINVTSTVAAIKASLKTDLSAEFGLSEATYDAFAGIIADAIGEALQHVKDDADVTGVTAGSDTVTGGVD